MKFFRHDIDLRQTDAVWELIETHGIAGYGFYWAVVEELYKAESSGFIIHATEQWQRRIKKQMNISDSNTVFRFLESFSENGAIDPQLWNEGYICIPSIVSEGNEYVKFKAKQAEKKRNSRGAKSKSVPRDSHESLDAVPPLVHQDSHGSLDAVQRVEVDQLVLLGSLLQVDQGSLSPKGSLSAQEMRERENSLSLEKQESETIATEPDSPNIKFNPVSTTPRMGEGESSAAAPAAIFKISRWADFVGPGNHADFWESVVKKAAKLPDCVDAESAAQSWIRKSGQLLWGRYEEDQRKRLNSASLQKPRNHPRETIPIETTLLPTCLPRDLGEAIAAIQVHLGSLNWSNQDAARYMQSIGKWKCERGATKGLLDGRGTGFMMLGDEELLQLHEEILKLRPGKCLSTPDLQMAS
jgi:hypothetical protein